MDNKHEIAMAQHWHGKAIHSKSKAVNYYKACAEEADAWATKALIKANSTERKDAMRMTRQDNAVEVFLCLFAVGLFLTIATMGVGQTVATIISYCGAGVFALIAVAYTWQEQRYRKTYQQQLNARLDGIMDGVDMMPLEDSNKEGGLDVTV